MARPVFSRRQELWWTFRLSRFGIWLFARIQFHLRRWRCERCGSLRGVKSEGGRTAYHYEGPSNVFQDPNRSVGLCRHCAVEYHQHWDDMWQEYYSGRL